MIEDLISIPGPVFLIIYLIYASIVIFGMRIIARNDHTSGMEVPEPTKLSPIDISIIRKGYKGAVIASIFNLWSKKIIEIKQKGRALQIKLISKNTAGLNKMENTICNFLDQPKLYRHFFNRSSIKTISKVVRPNMELLHELYLVPSDRIIRRYRRSFYIGLFLLFSLGGTKLYLGIVKEKPVTLLIILLVVSALSLFISIKPFDVKSSALGRKFLKLAERRFSYLKYNSNNTTLLADKNLQYGIAVLGISAFVTSGLGLTMENPILLETPSSNSSGCTGCSGCGGAGCGGGCGGCGGCGG